MSITQNFLLVKFINCKASIFSPAFFHIIFFYKYIFHHEFFCSQLLHSKKNTQANCLCIFLVEVARVELASKKRNGVSSSCASLFLILLFATSKQNCKQLVDFISLKAASTSAQSNPFNLTTTIC